MNYYNRNLIVGFVAAMAIIFFASQHLPHDATGTTIYLSLVSTLGIFVGTLSASSSKEEI